MPRGGTRQPRRERNIKGLADGVSEKSSLLEMTSGSGNRMTVCGKGAQVRDGGDDGGKNKGDGGGGEGGLTHTLNKGMAQTIYARKLDWNT